MKHEIFSCCEYASTHGGMLSICGVRDVFHAKQAPARLLAFSVVFRLHFDATEHGFHTFRLSVLDADGNSILPIISDGFDLRQRDDSTTFLVTKLFNMNGTVIPSFGDYRIELAVDDIPLLTRVVSLLPEP